MAWLVHAQWMGMGINVITPNKKMSSGPLKRYQELKRLQRASYIHYFYEVGTPPHQSSLS